MLRRWCQFLRLLGASVEDGEAGAVKVRGLGGHETFYLFWSATLPPPALMRAARALADRLDEQAVIVVGDVTLPELKLPRKGRRRPASPDGFMLVFSAPRHMENGTMFCSPIWHALHQDCAGGVSVQALYAEAEAYVFTPNVTARKVTSLEVETGLAMLCLYVGCGRTTRGSRLKEALRGLKKAERRSA